VSPVPAGSLLVRVLSSPGTTMNVMTGMATVKAAKIR
jgi:hypothetical protein